MEWKLESKQKLHLPSGIISQMLCVRDVLNTEDVSLNKIEICELRDFILVGKDTKNN